MSERAERRRVWPVIGKVVGTAALICFLGALVFFCIFALYIRNKRAPIVYVLLSPYY